jgi:dynein heavy chain
LAKTRTGHKRDQVEEDLRGQIDKFEEKLKVTNKELETFMKKDPPVLTMDEMRTSVQVIDKIDGRAQEAVETLREVNQEEVYLDWDPSNYPLLTKIRQLVERFGTLWHLALDFHENYEKWYYGPFMGLDTIAIAKQVIINR